MSDIAREELCVTEEPRRTPEEHLWLAVLMDGVEGVAKNNQKDVLWLANDSDEVCSYRWICEQLGIEPSWLRNLLATKWQNKKKAAYWRRIVLDWWKR